MPTFYDVVYFFGVIMNYENLPKSYELLNEPSSFLILDNRNISSVLSEKYKDFIKYPVGLYSNKDIDPVIVPDGFYLLGDDRRPISGLELDFDYIFKNKVPVRNVLSGKELIQHKKGYMYSKSPYFPYVGIYLTAIWLGEELNDSLLSLPDKYKINVNKFYNKLIGFNRKEINNKIIDEVLSDVGFYYNSMSYNLSDTLRKFIKNDCYHMYEIFLIGDRLELHKYCDFRIYEWSYNLEQDMEIKVDEQQGFNYS